MIRFFHSFYTRLSVLFLFLILVLGAGSILIVFTFTGLLIDEVEQQLNLGYADSMAKEIVPFLSEGFEQEKIESAIHYMMVLNPMVEIYLVNSHGKILAYFISPGEKIARDTIDLKPVTEFLKKKKSPLIFGDDPRSTDLKKPFSAAPLKMGREQGYLYIILRGQSFDNYFAALKDSYYLRTTIIFFFLALGATLLVGFLLFFFLTRRLRLLGAAVKQFKQGELFHRTSITGKDEIGVLGNVFNEMADTVESTLKKFKESEQMRRELVANISHDLRSPLTSIRGYVETILLKDRQLSTEKRGSYFEIILSHVDGLQHLVEELFELVMLETGHVRPSMEPIQIVDLAQDVVLKFKPGALAAGIEVLLNAPQNLPLITADISMIERVLNNLIDNALRFTPPGGVVSLNLHRQETSVTIEVTDTGSGIDPADLPFIFDRYYHVDTRAGKKSGGTGLGLAIARHIVELHGGTLTVQSSLGKGSCFAFQLSFTEPLRLSLLV
ncbi:MAG: HAMP domain-containing protein [Spirochaetales bacterium]|nr:HAMP domain-containing protein [Spirochaetales bacterium]